MFVTSYQFLPVQQVYVLTDQADRIPGMSPRSKYLSRATLLVCILAFSRWRWPSSSTELRLLCSPTESLKNS